MQRTVIWLFSLEFNAISAYAIEGHAIDEDAIDEDAILGDAINRKAIQGHPRRGDSGVRRRQTENHHCDQIAFHECPPWRLVADSQVRARRCQTRRYEAESPESAPKSH